ncbi:MAG: SpoIID/LytB domain-containing protein [Clostridia bacterium]|nr:SpoIID/LytB domain-containing protein [Clostridia bacterium]
MKKRIAALVAALLTLAALTACQQSAASQMDEAEQAALRQQAAAARDAGAPALPEGLAFGGDGAPVITIYNTTSEDYEDVAIEDYVMGVLAGEMRNDWPMEALKAQAILARTFVLKFISEKESKYPGAQISTDISEAQAYAPEAINDRIRKAVNDTRGLVLSADGELPYAWFHAHSGGRTELPVEGLSYEGGNPGYTQIVDSPDSDSAPTSVKQWEATFTAEEVAAAARETGAGVGETVNSIELGRKSESGRTVTFLINGREVSAPNLRVNLDSARLKSTLLDSVSLENGKVTFKGRGYGHGVGMSQWGAYALASEGQSAEDIVTYYFRDVTVARVW